MTLFSKQKTVKSTSFSEFIRNASSKEKKRVYSDVLKKATEAQNKVINQANQANQANDDK